MTFQIAPGTWPAPPPLKLLMAVLKPLEADVPGLKVCTKIEELMTTPAILARVVPGSFTNENVHGDSDKGQVIRFAADVHAYCFGVNAEDQCWALSEIAKQSLQAARLNHVVYPGIGSINGVSITSLARKANDWQTGTGVQQYSNLPKGTIRYQAIYGIAHRPDRRNRLSAADLVAMATNP